MFTSNKIIFNGFKMRIDLKTNLTALFMIIFWASAYVGIRAGLTGYTPGALALFRYLVASVCMLFIYGRFLPKSARPVNINRQELFFLFILGLLGFTIYNIALNYGEISITAGIASFLISQIPVVITLLAVIFFNDRLTFSGWIGTVVSMTGIFLISIGQDRLFHFDIGVLYILIAVFAGSLYSVFQKPLLRKFHPIQFTAYAIWFGTLALLIYLPSLVHEIVKAPLIATFSAIYLGIFPAAIAYLLWSYIINYLPASKAASYLYIVPPVTTIMGWLLLNEIPRMMAIVGGIIALFGAILVNLSVKHEKNIMNLSSQKNS